jgi:surfeit locus 1 family protein
VKLRNAIVLIAALLAAAGTARLGVWQLDRAAQKIQLQQALQSQRALPPLPVAELARDAATAATQQHRAVTLQGEWLASQTVYLENRQMHGQPGFYVLTPLRLADASVVLVQRGWVPRDLLDRTRIAAPPPPPGVVDVAGRIAPGPARLYDFAGAASGPIRQNLELVAFARETGLPLRPLMVVQEQGPGGPSDGLQRQWPAPAADVQKHHGYAFQWFALSALIIGLYVWFQLIRPRRARSA